MREIFYGYFHTRDSRSGDQLSCTDHVKVEFSALSLDFFPLFVSDAVYVYLRGKLFLLVDNVGTSLIDYSNTVNLVKFGLTFFARLNLFYFICGILVLKRSTLTV